MEDARGWGGKGGAGVEGDRILFGLGTVGDNCSVPKATRRHTYGGKTINPLYILPQ